MAAGANQAANNQEGSTDGNGPPNGISVPDHSVVAPTQAALRHNPGLSVEWASHEQSLLEELLAKYALEPLIVRYAKIAMQLRDKTVRDVALRCRWVNKKENGKRRKDENNSARKNKEKKEKVTDPSPKSSSLVTNHANGPPCAQSMIATEIDDGISYQAISGATGQLLEQNAQALDQISANFAELKINENFDLFLQARNSILTIMNDLNDVPEIMKQMPPLPVKLNDDLANSVFERSPSHQQP